jgi:hypothetical protein
LHSSAVAQSLRDWGLIVARARPLVPPSFSGTRRQAWRCTADRHLSHPDAARLDLLLADLGRPPTL